MPQYLGLQHVSVPATDLDRAEAFYCDQLGFQRIPRPPFDVEGIWLAAGEGLSVHITRSPHPHPTLAYHHFAIEVSDLQTALEHLTALGIAHYRGQYVTGAGKQAYLRDPDGNLIEFIERDKAD
jgi:catechol 2,3-dioxygenase-like lactoylglutathione lyase family enzyme